MAALLPIRSADGAYARDPRFGLGWLSSARVGEAAPLLVAIHGSHRDHLATRDAFAALAAAQPLHILAPLFPAGVVEAGYDDGYKFLHEPGLDYIALLDGMIADFAAQHPVIGKPMLFGFSGGAQCAHRYAYFRAAQLDGLVAAAAGAVTLPRMDLPWWPGLLGAQELTGHRLDLGALRGLPALVTIGAADRAAGILRDDPAQRDGSRHAGLAGADRIARAHSLHAALRDLGARTALIEVPGAGHELVPNATAALPFLGGWLAKTNHQQRLGQEHA